MATIMVAKKANPQQWLEQISADPSRFEAHFVVHTAEEIVFASKDLAAAESWIEQNQSRFANELGLFLVPSNFGLVRLRMLKIKSLSAGVWMPMTVVDFFLPDGKKLKIEMLVDSGADVTFVPFSIGQRLGFAKSFGESTLFASGVGSKVPYLIRECRIKIDQTELEIRLLWGQDEAANDILLGRMDVFDRFDITFSQRRGEVAFMPFSEKA